MRNLEEKIRDSEKKFFEHNKKSPTYIALSVYGYTELKREVAVRLEQDDFEWESDLNNYEGLKVLVSQDPNFEDFVLL